MTGSTDVAIKNLLFVCTGNVCRSPMAAELFAARARTRAPQMRVTSAGVAALVGKPPPGPVLALMAKLGIDASSHRGTQFTAELGSQQDLILVMETRQQQFIEKNWISLRGRVRRLGEWRGQDIPDPFGLPEQYYANCLGRIEECVDDWNSRLLS